MESSCNGHTQPGAEDVKLGNVLYAGAMLNTLTLNINGLRKKRKKALLGKLLRDLQIGVAIITETHLRESELGRVKYRKYHTMADYCRPTPEGQRIGGGVLILAHTNFSTEELPRAKELAPIIEHCACRIYPTANPITAIDIIGVYIPPSGATSLSTDLLHDILLDRDGKQEEELTPCLIAGDFNTTSWGLLYEEWVQTEGMIELVDPNIPTYASGTAIDKCLFSPGRYIPSTLLPTKGLEWPEGQIGMEEHFFPATALNYTHLGDHLPILLPLPCDAEETSSDKVNKVRVAHLTEDDWGLKDAELQQQLEKYWPPKRLTQPITNISRLNDAITRSLNFVFQKERRQPKKRVEVDPFEHFLLANLQHPDMPLLLAALEEKNAPETDKWMSRIGADGWKKYLQSVRKDDTRSFFSYLAKSEGRKQQGFVPADASPMLNEAGKLILTPREKVILITKTFHKKFSAPARINPQLPKENPNNIPLEPYRKKQMGPCQPIRLQEMLLAIAHLPTGKAPGPDGFPVEIYKHLPVLRPYLLALLNAMYETGEIPKELRRIYVAPITKPGKAPRDPNSKRPISLINTIMKIMEGILYQRLLPIIEPKLSVNQYAHRRQRGTEHHLVSIMDFANRALLRGENVYVISFDIAGAFDNVSHYQLTKALSQFHVDAYSHRMIHNWLRSREFSVKFRTPTGTFIGQRADISAGLPQGGVLSPLLWLLFFNDVQEQLIELRRQQNVQLTAYLDQIYADDITTIIIHKDLDPLREMAVQNVGNVRIIMGGKNLSLQDPKTYNLLMEAEILPNGIYRRGPPVSLKTTKTRLKEQYQKSAEYCRTLLEFDPETHPPLPSKACLAV